MKKIRCFFKLDDNINTCFADFGLTASVTQLLLGFWARPSGGQDQFTPLPAIGDTAGDILVLPSAIDQLKIVDVEE